MIKFTERFVLKIRFRIISQFYCYTLLSTGLFALSFRNDFHAENRINNNQSERRFWLTLTSGKHSIPKVERFIAEINENTERFFCFSVIRELYKCVVRRVVTRVSQSHRALLLFVRKFEFFITAVRNCELSVCRTIKKQSSFLFHVV